MKTLQVLVLATTLLGLTSCAHHGKKGHCKKGDKKSCEMKKKSCSKDSKSCDIKKKKKCSDKKSCDMKKE